MTRRSTSRRNQDDRVKGWKVALGIGTGLIVGGTLGYLIARSKIGQRTIEQIEGGDIRLPDPSFAMEVPSSDDQFAILDGLVCECGTPVVKAATESSDVAVMVEQITTCVLDKLYPQFPWPTIPGDHPSVGQLVAEVGVLARRALVTAEICPTSAPVPVQGEFG